MVVQATPLAEAAFAHVDSESSRRLLTAAVTAFAARGYHATTTRDITTAAGMSPAALYVHYASKEELLFEICRLGHEAALAGVRASLEGRQHPADRVRALVEDFTARHARMHTIVRVAQYELAALAPQHLEVVAELRRVTERVVREEVQRGVEAGVFTVPDVRLAALAVLSMGIDVARWFSPTGSLTPEELGASYGDLALRMLTAAG
jgi:AcrR family transcriptional regulator